MVIDIVEYSHNWPEAFALENQRLSKAIGKLVKHVEHIGSTAVQGLAAKPIIDIMPGVIDSDCLDQCIEPLQNLGYHYVPEYEARMPFRRYFWRQPDDDRQPGIHVHVVEYAGEFWMKHIRFRDLLRKDNMLRAQYAQLKHSLASQFTDSNKYADAKTEFIQTALLRAEEDTANTTAVPVAAIIEAFATALDGDDYVLAASLLSGDCVYELTGKTLEGRDAAIKSFKDNSEWAHANLENIVFIHEIYDCQDYTGTIKFIDFLEHAGLQMRHECLMHATVASNGLITKLQLEDLPGEKEKVSQFLASVGISRS